MRGCVRVRARAVTSLHSQPITVHAAGKI